MFSVLRSMRRPPIVPLVALVLLAACQAADPGSARSLVAVPTAEPPGPNAACMDALLSGSLAADEAAGVVIEAADGSRTVVVWPHGWVAVDEGSTRILLDHRGDAIARVGDRLEVGGGQGERGLWYTCGEVTRAP